MHPCFHSEEVLDNTYIQAMASVLAKASGNTLCRSFCCCSLKVDSLPFHYPTLILHKAPIRLRQLILAWDSDEGGAFCKMYNCQIEVRRSKFVFLFLAGSNMVETSPPLGFCCHFYKGTIVLPYNGRGGNDKVAQTAQNRKISFAESLLFYYLARQALSFGRRGRERKERCYQQN